MSQILKLNKLADKLSATLQLALQPAEPADGNRGVHARRELVELEMLHCACHDEGPTQLRQKKVCQLMSLLARIDGRSAIDLNGGVQTQICRKKILIPSNVEETEKIRSKFCVFFEFTEDAHE